MMKIFLDSSDANEIERAVETGLIDGVTTNPTLMLRAGRDPEEVLEEISDMFPWTSSISA
jgi:transaldolase